MYQVGSLTSDSISLKRGNVLDGVLTLLLI